MNDKPWLALIAGLCLVATSCGKSEAAAGRGVSAPVPPGAAPSPAAHSDCGHAVCADNFFVDIVSPNDCIAGATCRMTLKLVATGDFHINDEYPYRFRADDTQGVTFTGTDGAGKNVFSKAAANWTKGDAQNRSAAVTILPAGKPRLAIA